mmetsp:Transcript_54864/g.130670  ORF Transcript_54864/g.130670 Transcript_54864/m.130670 type:complete len:204 (-) Transcript_54864:2328-2939(-)
MKVPARLSVSETRVPGTPERKTLISWRVRAPGSFSVFSPRFSITIRSPTMGTPDLSADPPGTTSAIRHLPILPPPRTIFRPTPQRGSASSCPPPAAGGGAGAGAAMVRSDAFLATIAVSSLRAWPLFIPACTSPGSSMSRRVPMFRTPCSDSTLAYSPHPFSTKKSLMSSVSLAAAAPGMTARMLLTSSAERPSSLRSTSDIE